MSAKNRTRSVLPGLSAKHSVFVVEYVKDFNARRAAEYSGIDPDRAYDLLKRPDVTAALELCITSAFHDMGIDAESVMWELWDNHRIARYGGNISASNTALKTLMQHVNIDAMAKQRMEMEVVGDEEMAERLRKGRERVAGRIPDEAVEKFFGEEDDAPSFL